MTRGSSSFSTLCLLLFFLGQDVLTVSSQVETILTKIDNPVQTIHWLTKERVLALSKSSTVYLSTDGGRSWTSLRAKTGDVKSVHISAADNNYVVFLGRGKQSWATSDMGRAFQELTTPHVFSDLQLHPAQPEWMLASYLTDKCTRNTAKGNCYKILHYSQDLGVTWKVATEYVVQWAWSPAVGPPDKKGRRASDTIIYASIIPDKSGNQVFGAWDADVDLVATTDFFKTSKVLVEHGNRFSFGDFSYFFVAAVRPRDPQQVALMVSRDNRTINDMPFLEAVLPVELTQHSYTIVDTSEAAVFLHVNHRPFTERAPAGHIYTSDWRGLTYALSLRNNVRSITGECDFQKINGLQGIYIANVLDVDGENIEDEEMTAERRGVASKTRRPLDKDKVLTVITFDKGGEWSYISPPEFDSENKKIDCGKDCHLHLNGPTSDRSFPYSAESAPGIIVATGNVGQHLDRSESSTNTYLSTDAGLTWKEIRKGSHIYELGDRGGLLVMAPNVKQTTELVYSWDQGTTFGSVTMSEPVRVENIIIEPTSNGYGFILHGSSNLNEGVLIYVNFEDLHQRECEGHDAPDTKASDYETWTPSDGRIGTKCLLGSQATYVRRKPDKACFNPQDVEPPIRIEYCSCTLADF